MQADVGTFFYFLYSKDAALSTSWPGYISKKISIGLPKKKYL